MAAAAAVLLWAGGLTALTRRVEKPPAADARQIEAATHFNPGPVYYLVERNGKQVGFASASADTIPTGIEFQDYLVLELMSDSTKRMAIVSNAKVSRALAVTSLEVGTDTGTGWIREGAALNAADSTFTFRTIAPRTSSSTAPGSRLVLAPDVIPMVIGMGGPPPRVGGQLHYGVVDVTGGRVAPVTFRVAAESLFVVSDSAVRDTITRHWRPASSDTVRAWKIVPQSLMLTGAPSVVAWVDAQGRVVDADADVSGAGTLHFRRMCYELAYRNWPGRRFK